MDKTELSDQYSSESNVIEIEGIGNDRIRFNLITSVRAHICEFSGEARGSTERDRDYPFLYGPDCELHLKISGGNQTIVIFDLEGRCRKYFYATNGVIGGVTLKLVK